jgi:hypothetical protein
MADEVVHETPPGEEGDDTVNTPDDAEKVTSPEETEVVPDHKDPEDDDDDS